MCARAALECVGFGVGVRAPRLHSREDGSHVTDMDPILQRLVIDSSISWIGMYGE